MRHRLPTALLLAAALAAPAAAQVHPAPRAGLAGPDGLPVVTLGYTPLLDQSCAEQSGQPLDPALVETVRGRTAAWDAEWRARGPALMRAAREVAGAPWRFAETRAAVTTCVNGSMSFPLILNARSFLRLSPDSLADERAFFVNTLFHELLHRYVGERTQQLPGGTTPLLRKYARETLPVRNHVHLFAIERAVYERLGLTRELERLIEDDRRLRQATMFARAREIVAAEGAEAFLRELRP